MKKMQVFSKVLMNMLSNIIIPHKSLKLNYKQPTCMDPKNFSFPRSVPN